MSAVTTNFKFEDILIYFDLLFFISTGQTIIVIRFENFTVITKDTCR